MKFLIPFFMLMHAAPAGATAPKPVHLTCDYAENPLGIENPLPVFGWNFSPSASAMTQSAYEIEVTDGRESVWSSGKVLSAQNIAITYQGKSLTSRTRYIWRLRIYDQHDQVSPWSDATWFETGLMIASDWESKWITDGSLQFEKDEDFYKPDRMPLFRKDFELGKKIQQARLYICGLGYYEAFLNGQKIGDHVLDPGWTTYKKEALYVVHDITSLIKQGNNKIGVMLGNGWYNPLPMKLFSRFNLRDAQVTGRPCLRAEIYVTYTDGSVEKIFTDETWKVAAGPVVKNNVYLGEHYDARLEQKQWLSTHLDPAIWKPSSIRGGPPGKLTAQLQPPVKITKIIKPITVKALSSGVYIADMGENFAGVAGITVKGKAGDKVTLRYGEALQPDGSLNFLTTTAGQIKEMWKVNAGPGAPATAWQEDSYTLKGEGVEHWNPAFTFHGFRYVEITGWPGKPDVNSIKGLRMNADLQQSGDFACSNSMFNELHTAIKRTFLSNVFSVQSDCPGREKMGYGADIVVTANAFMYNFDMTTFYKKTISDITDEQQEDGGITEIAPSTGIADKGYGGKSGPLGWELVYPYLQQQLYLFYGDKNIIADHYPAIQKQMSFLIAHAIDGLFLWDISDHIAIDPKPEALSASAFYYHHAKLAAEFAGILYKTEDSVRYATLANRIRQNIINKFYVPGTGRFDNATQSAQLFALWYDLSPDKDLSFDVLLQEIHRHRDHVSSGIFGVRMMFDVLRLNDQNDLAYKIADQRDYPGWGYMLAKGATTLWEDWEYPDNSPSQNHPMFGSVDEWFYRSLLGINAVAPGFKKIVIKPQPAGDLTWAKGNYQSVHGKIGSEWRLSGDRYFLSIIVPPNTTATVWIRSTPGQPISENGSTVNDVTYRDGYGIVKVGSGAYHFESMLR